MAKKKPTHGLSLPGNATDRMKSLMFHRVSSNTAAPGSRIPCTADLAIADANRAADTLYDYTLKICPDAPPPPVVDPDGGTWRRDMLGLQRWAKSIHARWTTVSHSGAPHGMADILQGRLFLAQFLGRHLYCPKDLADDVEYFLQSGMPPTGQRPRVDIKQNPSDQHSPIPDGYELINNILERYKVSRSTIMRAIQEGFIKTCRYGPKPPAGHRDTRPYFVRTLDVAKKWNPRIDPSARSTTMPHCK